MINMVKVRHNNVVPTMALGVEQLKKELGRSRKVPFEFDEIHEFLDRFYMSRIGIHMLIGSQPSNCFVKSLIYEGKTYCQLCFGQFSYWTCYAKYFSYI
jgi:hypothetical protein